MSFTVDAVRRLINIPELTDEFIEGYAEDGYTTAIDVAIALCDYMASGVVSGTEQITVGPITLKNSSAGTDWHALKKDFILRKNTGAGVPDGGIGLAGLTFFGGATQTGNCQTQSYIKQFDNPPGSVDCGCDS